jgi:hypothetical protein
VQVIDHETRGRFLARDLNVLSTGGWMTIAADDAITVMMMVIVMKTEIGWRR